MNLSASDSPYHYSKVTYSLEDVDKLLRLTQYNICNNQERLLEALCEAVQRRRQRTQHGEACVGVRCPIPRRISDEICLYGSSAVVGIFLPL